MEQNITPQEFTVCVETYVSLRDKKRELEAAHKKALESIEADMEFSRAVMTKYLLDTNGQNGAKTVYGTVSLLIQHRVRIFDKSAVADFIKDTGETDLFDIRPAKNALLEYEAEHGALPSGIEKSSEYVVRVTAPR